MTTKIKKLFGILLTLALVLGLLPGMTLTALADDYTLWVGGTQVTSANKEDTTGTRGWSFDDVSYTLTLNNYSYSGRGYGDNNAAAIYYKGGKTLKIVINGTCSLTSTGDETQTHSFGIFAATNCSLEFSGSGSLAVTGCQSSSDNVGIMAGMNVTISGGAVTAIGGQCTSETSSTSSYGICSYAGTIQIGNNVRYVEAKGYNSAIYALKQSVKNEIPGTGWTNTAGTQGKASIVASTSGQTIDTYKKVQFPAVTDYPLWVGGIQVDSANAEDTTGTRGWSFDPVSYTLTLNNFTYSGPGHDNAAIYYFEDYPLKIVLNGTNSITGTDAGICLFASGTYATLEISGSGSLTAEGGTTGGIISRRGITVNGGTITATGGRYGITVFYTGENLTINNCELTAVGGTKGIDATKVINKIPGIGWTDMAGTQGKAYIDVSTEGQKLDDYKKVQFQAAPTTYSTVSIANADHTIGDGKDAVLTVKGDPDTRTYDNFDGVEMDGKAVSADNYTTAKGSLILTLKSSYLDTLSAGDHKVTIKFNDGGTATAALKVTAATTPTAAPTTAPTPTPTSVPKTGDSGNPLLWLLIALLGVSLLGITVKQYCRK